jgi:hypothetical protein
MIVALKYRSPVMFPLIITGVYGFISTGIWMIKSVTSPEIMTDYTYMIKLGFSEYLLPIIGIIYISFGFMARIFFLPLAGIDSKSNYKARFTVYLAGIVPWFILQGLYNMVFNSFSLLNVFLFLVPIIVYTSLEALISLPLQRKVNFFKHIPSQQIKPRHFITILVFIMVIYTAAVLVNTFFSSTP